MRLKNEDAGIGKVNSHFFVFEKMKKNTAVFFLGSVFLKRIKRISILGPAQVHKSVFENFLSELKKLSNFF